MKIVHISDLHTNIAFRKHILKKITYLFEQISLINPDHIIITGDLTDNADRNDFLYLRNLFDKFGWLKPEKLSLIIGNHDIFGGIQLVDDILNFPRQCINTDYNRRIRDFTNYFYQAFLNCYFPDPATYFPYGKVLGDILLIGINSIAQYSKIKNPFGSNGQVGIHQFNQVRNILEKYKGCVKTKIVMIHHHFNRMKNNSKGKTASVWNQIEKQTMKLRKKKRLLSLFKEFDIDIVLHGHVHLSEEYTRNGIRFLNSGATITGKKSDILKYNLISTENNLIKTEINEILFEKDKTKMKRRSKSILLPVSD